MKVDLIDTTSDDFDIYYMIRSCPGDVYWNGYIAKPDKEAFRKLYYNRISSAPFINDGDRRNYFIRISNGDNESKIVGFVQLIRHEINVEIGYTVIDEYQGRGYGTAALELGIKLALKQSRNVVVRIRDDNIASQKIAINNGFIATEEYETMQYQNMSTEVKLRTYVFVNLPDSK